MTVTTLPWLRQPEALQRRKCDCWHLIVCADFSRSAPLDSPFGTSLPRRSLSSPDILIITQPHLIEINLHKKISCVLQDIFMGGIGLEPTTSSL